MLRDDMIALVCESIGTGQDSDRAFSHLSDEDQDRFLVYRRIWPRRGSINIGATVERWHRWWNYREWPGEDEE